MKLAAALVTCFSALILVSGCADEDPKLDASAKPQGTTATDIAAAEIGGEAAVENAKPMVVRVAYRPGIGDDGTPGTGEMEAHVRKLGALNIGNTLPTVDAARAAFGDDFTAAAQPETNDECLIDWPNAGVSTIFSQRHAESPNPCADGFLNVAMLTGNHWSTAKELAVGDSAARIKKVYPKAKLEPLTGDLAKLAGTDEAHAIEVGGYGGDPYTTLWAVTDDGKVTGLLYFNNAD
jgi:hypothetical protein